VGIKDQYLSLALKISGCMPSEERNGEKSCVYPGKIPDVDNRSERW
jgi:hypothetical protein